MREFVWNCYLLVWWVQRAISPQLEQSLSKAKADLISLCLWMFVSVYLYSLSVLLLCPFSKDCPHLVHLEAALGVHC